MDIQSNIAPFYAGEKVIAVDAVQGSFFKNKQHYIISTCYSAMCNGKYYWYVGIVGGPHSSIRPSIFKSIQQKEFPLMTFKEIIKLVKLQKLEILMNN